MSRPRAPGRSRRLWCAALLLAGGCVVERPGAGVDVQVDRGEAPHDAEGMVHVRRLQLLGEEATASWIDLAVPRAHAHALHLDDGLTATVPLGPGLLDLGWLPLPPGRYDTVAIDVAPAPSGAWAGRSVVVRTPQREIIDEGSYRVVWPLLDPIEARPGDTPTLTLRVPTARWADTLHEADGSGAASVALARLVQEAFTPVAEPDTGAETRP